MLQPTFYKLWSTDCKKGDSNSKKNLLRDRSKFSCNKLLARFKNMSAKKIFSLFFMNKADFRLCYIMHYNKIFVKPLTLTMM